MMKNNPLTANDAQTIRAFFTPIQPSVKAGQGHVFYREFPPDEQLKNAIHCYWQLQSHQVLAMPYNYRAVSDGCVDIFFNLNDTTESFVMGFCKQYTEFPIGTTFNYAGIRFFPSVFPQLFDISAKSISGKEYELAPILPTIARFIETEMRPDLKASLPKLDELFSGIVQNKALDIDSRFQDALLQICKKKGYLETESELDVGLSPRQLRRLFNYYIGTTPKSFSQVVRFQYILNAKPSSQSLKQNKIFYDVGFCDQAHFIKNFTKFYGVTPAKAFR